jgi:hypothetical protein
MRHNWLSHAEGNVVAVPLGQTTSRLISFDFPFSALRLCQKSFRRLRSPTCHRSREPTRAELVLVIARARRSARRSLISTSR